MAEVSPKRKRTSQPHGGLPNPSVLCQEGEFPPHLTMKISEDSVCSTRWDGRQLGTQTLSCRANTWTHLCESWLLVEGVATWEALGHAGKD